jgi:hypothetical protein
MGDKGRGLTFGIYPGGAVGGESGILSGPPDDLEKVNACLDHLQQNSHPFVVRCYDSYQDADSPLRGTPSAPKGYPLYIAFPRRQLELVLQFRSSSGDIPSYLKFVREKIQQHANILYAVQITEESNFTNGPDIIDGAYAKVLNALVAGVREAKTVLHSLGRGDVKVGFSVTPTFGPSAEYWARLRDVADKGFDQNIDYVGLDFFPDTFHPIAFENIAETVQGTMKLLRQEWMPTAGLGDRVAISVTEHGWPTGPERNFERQAKVLEEVISTIHKQRESLNIDRYTLFALRDVDFSTPQTEKNLFYFFGITTADYEPKPAFETYARLIKRFGRGV